MPMEFSDPYFNNPNVSENFSLKIKSLEKKLEQIMKNKENFSQKNFIPAKNNITNQKKRIENVLLFVMTFIFIGQIMENSF